MIKELKNVLYIVVIFLFVFLNIKYYISDNNKKKSYRLFQSQENKLSNFILTLPNLKNDTMDVIEYVDNENNENKKKYYRFWELLKKND